jgi:acetyl-CoA hydrolase
MTAGQLDLGQFIRPGDTVLVGQSTAEPRALLEALIEQRHALAPLTLFVGSSYTGLLRPEHADAFRFVGYGAVGRTGALVRAGVLELHPVHFGALSGLITSGRIPVDVVLAQVSAAAPDGTHSLGLVADYLAPAISVARATIAEVNPRVPYTYGDTVVAADRLAAVLRDDRSLIGVERRAPLPEDERIAELIAALVPDGATIQFGIGGTPDAVLTGLQGHRQLGVHSGILSEAFLDLLEAGVVTNERKEIDTGVTVTGALLGTERLYEWAHDNRALSMRSAAYTHDGAVLAALGSLHAINSAVEVDLTGQINGESAGGRYIGLVGGQAAFARAALMSPAGRSIVAMPATAQDGTISRIVPRLGDGIVSTSRADADLVVTEHGVADLRGATLRERAERLVAIADPRHRGALEAAVGAVVDLRAERVRSGGDRARSRSGRAG